MRGADTNAPRRRRAKVGKGRGGRGDNGPPSGDGDGSGIPPIRDAPLAREAEQRYLTYALSVISSRALPDVRDGLKPVQRRILYAMHHDLGLRPDSRFRKSAAVVGDVMGKYHPHGDQAIYDAMVRMAQPFAMRAPLVEGQGNYGSPDGDGAAAMRYTEARLQGLALELIEELSKETVERRANYDGTREEPVVFPARYPNLLVNGAQGIAVGMATSIPPHNFGEVINACVAIIDAPGEVTQATVLKHIKGPDFPTGGQLTCSKSELATIYAAGHGSLKLRGEWSHEPAQRRGDNDIIVLSSMPYAVERRAVVEKIAEAVIKKKLPPLLDVRDESTDEVRVVLELKRGADPQLVMAYLYKHSPLQTSVQVNLTCLTPSEGGVSAPARLSLLEMLQQFLSFRFATVTRRTEFELSQLLKRIHILEGFEIIFDALDLAIAIIRKSDGKADAALKLVGRFGLSALQADAVLELKLYRLSKLEILAIQRELAEKRAQARKLQTLLKSESMRWALIRDEFIALKSKYADKRRTKIAAAVHERAFAAEDYIAAEDATVILMASGWVKRGGKISDVNRTRMREGDRVLAAVAGSTKASIAFFSNLGVCYVCRIDDIPAATGYGEPIQKLFKLGDGERLVGAMSFDPRVVENKPADEAALEPEPPYALAVTRGGLGMRFSLRGHAEPSTRTGRKFARLNAGDEVFMVGVLDQTEWVDWIMCASSDGHAIAVPCEDVSLLSGAGKGVIVMKLAKASRLIGARLGHRDLDALSVETDKGTKRSLTLRAIEGPRGGRGAAIVRRGGFSACAVPPVETPHLEQEG